MKFAWPDGYGYTDGRPPVFWMPFAALGTLLIPSAITFIQTGKKPKSPSTRSARILQTLLFAIVLALTWPALLLMLISFGSNVPVDYVQVLHLLLHPSLFVACVLGIISFPIMWRITRSLVPKKIRVPVHENQNLIKQ
jgi:fatty acid desaturase